MQWNIVSRTIELNSDARYLFKGILSKYSDVNELISKFNLDIIVLNNDELTILHSVLVEALNNCSEDESNFITGFLDNIS